MLDRGRYRILREGGLLRYRSVLGISILVVLYFTLFPFDFELGTRSLRDVAAELDLSVGGTYLYTDVPLNVILFVPFGFGLAGSLAGRRNRRPLFIAVLGTLVVSALVELLQGYALLRDPAAPDIVANGFGGGLGVLAFVRAGDPIMERLSRVLRRADSSVTNRTALVAYGAFFIIVVVGSVAAQNATRLSNWDVDYGLTIGNESTGDRPWDGSIRAYQLFDRSLSDDDVGVLFVDPSRVPGDAPIASRDFTNGDASFPPLVWNSGTPLNAAAPGARLGADDWLRSSGDVAPVSRALIASAQFTLALEVATMDLTQSGPARLFSISAGLINRNLTLGQDGSSLVVRIRTPLTGHDAVPELTVPGVFVDTTMQRIVVRYDGASVRVGIDGAADVRSIEIGPEAVMMLGTYPIYIARIRLNPISTWMFRVIYRVFVFAPWAAILVRVHRRRARSDAYSRSLAAVAVFAPAVILELALSTTIGVYERRLSLLILNVGLIGIVMWSLLRAPPSGHSPENHFRARG